ncbi:MAG: formylglycine-generating enzyme family protein [Acidobacteria bacterium]|nr:formylglycine-generating enzyme family protein [Acidobacteriota bacterium]
MKKLKILLIIFTILIINYLPQTIFAQDIGIFSEPAPAKKKTPEKTVTRKPPPPRKTSEPAEKPKRRVTLTIISDPLECEIYLNDIYRGTTASLNGKLVIPDLDTTVSYSLRVYKRGIGEEVKTLALSQDQEIQFSLKDKTASNNANKPNNPDKNNSTELALNTSSSKEPTKEPDKETVKDKEPDKELDKELSKEPIKQPDKEPIKPTNDTSVAINTSPANTVTTSAKPVITPPQREMVLIAGGEVTIGSNSSIKTDLFRPQHKVSVGAFFIDVYEVNNADYKLFCDATNRTYPPNPTWDKDYFLSKPNFPVINVSWEDATAYANWVGKRLPTEEEWEKAARGTDGRNWPWGKDYQVSLANLAGTEDGFEYTSPIGNFPGGLSPYGAQDMIGNVWEWTSSLFKPYPGGTDDARYVENNEKYRVIRGGGYNSPLKDLRTVAFRFPGELKQRYVATGFRCAKSQ